MFSKIKSWFKKKPAPEIDEEDFDFEFRELTDEERVERDKKYEELEKKHKMLSDPSLTLREKDLIRQELGYSDPIKEDQWYQQKIGIPKSDVSKDVIESLSTSMDSTTNGLIIIANIMMVGCLGWLNLAFLSLTRPDTAQLLIFVFRSNTS